MARRGLKNVVRRNIFRNGQASWTLLTVSGDPIPAFDYFCEKNSAYVFRTQKRYAEVASRFIDYLYEAKIFCQSVAPRYLNDVIEAFPTLLRDGSAVTSSRVRNSNSHMWLAEVAEALNWDPLKPNSFSNTIAPINRFLKLSESLAREANKRATTLGVNLQQESLPLVDAVEGFVMLSRHEIVAMQQNSMLGNVAKYAPTGIQRARGLRSPSKSSSSTCRVLDFPRESLPSLIRAADSWRDKSFWLMLAATGIRASEALNLRLEDIDFEAQRVYVFDPKARRATVSDKSASRLRFKGREMANTYLIPELRRDLFYALRQYLQFEFVPCYRPGEAAYLFQYIEATKLGRPYVDASHAALTQSFRRALRNADIAVPRGGRNWALHSLRHMYGVYMVNDLPVDPQRNQFGLPLAEVQMMMGHASIQSTAHYARSKHRRLEKKLAAADEIVLGMTAKETQELPIFDELPRDVRE